MSSVKRNIKLLEDYKTVYKRRFKNEINNLIQFYESRKAYNVRTVKNVLDKLTDRDNKKNIALGLSEYQKLYEKYKDAEPVPIKIKRLREERILNERRGKAVLKIQNMLRNTVIIDIVRHESALDGKVIEVTVKPQRIGTVAAMDIKTILYKSFFKAVKMLPKKSGFKFYSSINFTTNDKGRSSLVSNEYTPATIGSWSSHVESQIEKAVQSDEQIKLNSLLIKFDFVIMPAGGRGNATQERDRESIFNKSVLRIKNDDNNGFWYALSALVHKNIRILEIAETPSLERDLLKNYATNANSLGVEK